MKTELENQARQAGRSLSEEIELRLERSLDTEKAFGGPQTQRMLRTLASLAPDDEWVHSWFLRRAVFSDWWRRVIEESPSRLAMDLQYCKEKCGTNEAKELAVSYYSRVIEKGFAKFTKSERQEYCQLAKEILGFSLEELAAKDD